MNCTDKTQAVSCGEEVVIDASTTEQPPVYQPFSFCHMGRTYSYDGVGLTVAGAGVNVPNGVYSTVSVQNNCITGFGESPVPIYTPPPCVGEPTGGCGEGGSGGGTLDPSADNMSTDGLSGLKTKLYTVNTATVTLSGAGTVASPLMATALGGGSGGTIVAGAGIKVQTSQAGPAVSLRPVGITSGVYNGFSVNEFGQILSYASPAGGTPLNAVLGAGDVRVNTSDSGVATVSLPLTSVGAAYYNFGAYQVRHTASGLVAEAIRVVDIEPFVMTVPDYTESPPQFRQVSVDSYGTVLASALIGSVGVDILPDTATREFEVTLTLTNPITVLGGFGEIGEITCVKATLNKKGLLVNPTLCAPYFEQTPTEP